MKLDIRLFFEKLPRKFKLKYSLARITDTLHKDQYTFLIISRWILRRMRNVSDKSFRENQNTHFVFNGFFPRKSCRSWNNVEKYCRAGHATDDSMAHAHFMLDTQGYKHTLKICNTHCFSTTTLVARTRLTLYVHWYITCRVPYLETVYYYY